jgi:predicted permease
MLTDRFAPFRRVMWRLARKPGYSTFVVFPLALALGANAAVFGMVRAILLEPLPFANADRLVTVDHVYPSLGHLKPGVSAPGFREYAEQAEVLSQMAVQAPWEANLVTAGGPYRVQAMKVSSHYFSVLGVAPAQGRLFHTDEDRPGVDRVVIVGDAMWRSHFGGASDLIGRRVRINREDYEVVGILPPAYVDVFNEHVQLWTPLALAQEDLADRHRSDEWLTSVARLAPGTSLAQARDRLGRLAEQIRARYPRAYPSDWTLNVDLLHDRVAGAVRPMLIALFGAVGLVLLIACANISGLQLVRTPPEAQERAVKMALGASSWDLIKDSIGEHAVLSSIAGVAGVMLAYVSLTMVAAYADGLPRARELRVDVGVVAFTAVLTVLCTLACGLLPAMQASGWWTTEWRSQQQRGHTYGRGVGVLRRTLIVAQVTAAVVLLAAAGLLVRSFERLSRVDAGFDPAGVITAQVMLPRVKGTDVPFRGPESAPESAAAFFDTLLERLSHVGGIDAVGLTSLVPLSGVGRTSSFLVRDQPTSADGRPHGDIRAVSGGYFAAMRIPILRGRVFNALDGPFAPLVCIVDEGLAARYWPGRDPVGQYLAFDAASGEPRWRTVVGVVRRVHHESLTAVPRDQVYVPFSHLPAREMALVARTEGNPAALVPEIRAILRSIDDDVPLDRVQTMEAVMTRWFERRQILMALMAGFSAIALLLSAIGLYCVLSQAIVQRTREIGVRIALGASPVRMFVGVLTEGVGLAIVGIALGLLAATSSARLLRSQLYAIQATDPVTLGGVALVLTTVALVTAYMPARRAARVDPVVLMRAD